MLGLGRWRAAAPAAAPAPVDEAQRPPSTSLPAIKCSNCGADIEIMSMADHICSAPTQEPESYEPPPRPVLQRAETMDSISSNADRKSFGFLRPGRQPPPKIDANAANKPFARPPPGALTPVSDYSNPRSVSPFTPASGKRTIQRSATSPMPRPYSPPSPEFTSNLDCAFPPFPGMPTRSNTPTGSRSKSRERKLKVDPNSARHAEPSPRFAPLSPRLDAGANIVRKMDNISPGPFDGREGSADRRPSTSHGVAAAAQKMRQDKRTSSESSNHGRSRSVNSMHSKGSRGSTQSVGLPANPKSAGAAPPPSRPPRPNDEDTFEGIDSFLRRIQDDQSNAPAKPLASQDRAGTFPIRKQSRAGLDELPGSLARRPSEPITRPRGQSNATISSVYSSDSTDAPPVPPMPSLDTLTSFGPSRPPPRNDSRSDKPMPSPLNSLRSPIDNPLHTPSDSMSSDGSMLGFGARSASSVSSAPGSEVSGPVRTLSKSPDAQEGFTSMRSRQGSDAMLSDFPAPLSPNPSPRSLPFGQQPGLGRMNAPEHMHFHAPPSIPATVEELPESPMDPAIQMGLFSQQRPSKPSVSNASSQPRAEDFPAPPPPREPASAPTPAPVTRQPTSGKKAKCRGCGEQIVGKSVKAADGRLTGRWHKHCFTCKTCNEPFQTADFYVLNNHPYCEHHYHQLNNSLCQLCNRGIEGQFLETDKRKKYHPRCFTCSHCRIPLRDDYFEWNGRPYCERHAQHAASQTSMLGTGARRFPERRTTKLMMMM